MRRLAFVLGVLLVTGAAPQAEGPRVDLLVPGITVKRLPVDLTNINSLEYGPDGRLFAAGYDGEVHVLTDTDGDGLEDRAVPFWDRKGDLLTPVGMAVTEEGVYLAARGKIVLLKDTDGDGRGDASEIIATGWVKERYNRASRNDASGIALDKEGNLYFSLGCHDYRNAFLLDKDKKPRYSLKSERGTIVKVSRDRKRREIVCTGIRFAVGLAINRHGDLFATDQEGDTWFPGGNPLDELAHIIPGRHYGFPFRHPEYLPDVVDEPPVVGFGPQHQSTCGLRFNEARPGRKAFGPPHWEGDAFVTGFSRGKLWRVPLVKTRAGYVGKPVLIASFAALPTDVTISPEGRLVVAAHGGRPDWGSGPKGKGHLLKFIYADPKAPQPAVAWPAGPLETRVAFTGPVDAPEGVELEAGAYVRAGDRFETIRPGYKVVKRQQVAPKHPLRISQSRSDGRTLRLTTTAHPWRATYALSLPDRGVYLDYDLSGVEAKWIPAREGESEWRGWLPHLDTIVAKHWTRGSSEHARLFRKWKAPGHLSLRARLDLPARKTMIRLEASGPFTVSCGEVRTRSRKAEGRHRADLTVERAAEPHELHVTLRTRGATHLDASFRTDVDPHERPFRREHLLVPWAPLVRPAAPPTGGKDLTTGGDWERGRKLFFSDETKCGTCHAFDGQGGKIAPDLSYSRERDPAAVMQDIVEPSAAINPDFVSYVVRTREGDVLAGMLLREEDGRLRVVDAQGKPTVLDPKDVAAVRSSALSLMPAGYGKLSRDKLRDLVTFLCRKKPSPKK